VSRGVGWLSGLDERRTAALLVGAIFLIGIVGALTLWLDPENPWTSLDAEIGPAWPPDRATVALPAIWSALTLTLAGFGWLAVSWLRPVEGIRFAAALLGLLLLFAAVDEIFIVHERLESRTGVDWQLIYGPVAAFATALLAVLVWRVRHRGRGIAWMLSGGGLCWVIAAGLEYLQWRGDEEVEIYPLLMLAEELLELGGTALLLLAAIGTLQSTARVATDSRPSLERPL
jgi:hypothetical protein